MLVSVIIPSYKPGEYLWECLDSLVAQTFKKDDFEVILVLNGCTEPYKSAIKRYIAENMRDMNINFIHTEIGGVSNARNIGLDAACGEYIAFVDDDDLVSENYLEQLYRVSSSTCVGCANSYAFVDSIKDLKYNFITKAFNKCSNLTFSTLKYRSFLSPPICKLIHKDIIGSDRFSTFLKKGEDGMFCFAISVRIPQMKLTSDDVIYYQRLRDGSAMRTKNSLKIEFIEAFRQEKVLFSLWIKHPFSYNIFFMASRAIGIISNFIKYIR